MRNDKLFYGGMLAAICSFVFISVALTVMGDRRVAEERRHCVERGGRVVELHGNSSWFCDERCTED